MEFKNGKWRFTPGSIFTVFRHFQLSLKHNILQIIVLLDRMRIKVSVKFHSNHRCDSEDMKQSMLLLYVQYYISAPSLKSCVHAINSFRNFKLMLFAFLINSATIYTNYTLNVTLCKQKLDLYYRNVIKPYYTQF